MPILLALVTQARLRSLGFLKKFIGPTTALLPLLNKTFTAFFIDTTTVLFFRLPLFNKNFAAFFLFFPFFRRDPLAF